MSNMGYNYDINYPIYNDSLELQDKLTSLGISNDPYPDPNQSNSPHWQLFTEDLL